MANNSEKNNSTNFLGNSINFNNYAANLAKQMTPLFEASKTLSLVARSTQEAQMGAIASLISTNFAHSQAITDLSKIFENMGAPFQDLLVNLENIIKDFSKVFDKIPERTRKALMVLAQHGWFLDYEMPFEEIWKIESVLENGDTEAANLFLAEHFTERLPEIEQTLKEKHPKRANIFETVFNVHRRKEYILSIPTFLIQADGICFDLIEKQLYSKRKNVPAINEYAQSINSDILLSALLYPLTQPLPITASSSERQEGFNELNRHQIIHGEITDYDTEINSLKAISLLNYVSWVLSQDDNPDNAFYK